MDVAFATAKRQKKFRLNLPKTGKKRKMTHYFIPFDVKNLISLTGMEQGGEDLDPVCLGRLKEF
jgi:hypothetical protein